MKDTKMNCTDVREKLSLFVGGDLDPDVLRFVGAHLASCEPCALEARAAERAREVLVASLTSAGFGLSSDLWEGVRAELIAEGRLGAAIGSSSEAAAGSPSRGDATSRKITEGRPHTLRPVPAESTHSARVHPLRRVVGLAAAAAVLLTATVVAPRFLSGARESGVPGSAPVARTGDAGGATLADAALPVDASTMGLRAGEVKLQPVFGASLLERSRTLRDEVVPVSMQEGPNALAGNVGTRRRVR